MKVKSIKGYSRISSDNGVFTPGHLYSCQFGLRLCVMKGLSKGLIDVVTGRTANYLLEPRVVYYEDVTDQYILTQVTIKGEEALKPPIQPFFKQA